MDESKILFIIASDQYNATEYSVPKQIVIDAGFIVVTASDKSGEAVATDQSTTEVDITLEKVVPSNYLGIFFVGGTGALEHLDNTVSYKIIQQALQHNIAIGAICVSTRILAQANALINKSATGWNDDNQLETIYKEYHVQYVNKPVVIDDNIITAVGPSAAKEFGEKIVQILQRKQSWG